MSRANRGGSSRTPVSGLSTLNSRARPSLSPTPSVRTPTSPRPPRSPVSSRASSRRTTPTPEDLSEKEKKPQLSIREQIALRRAEAKKAQSTTNGATGDFDFGELEDALPIVAKKQTDDEVDLGRWSVKDTIDRARSTGAINLASRALPCLPSALFEVHLGVKPEPLASVPVEPPITTSSADDSVSSRRRGGNSNVPSWYEAQDLEVLKAWSNEIVEIQPEISMFGSLKTVDLHNNKLITLPDTFADLTALTVLDLSHNSLTSLPENLWALPHLTTLNLSHNSLTALPLQAPFDADGSNPLARTRDPRGDWFCQSITRATMPLPRLTTLDLSYNQLSAAAIDHAHVNALPPQLTKIDLSANPLGECKTLLQALARLERLSELRMEHADIGNDSIPVDLLSIAGCSRPFPVFKVFDLGETHVTLPVIEAAFRPPALKQELEFEVTTDEPRDGVLRIILGKKVIREAWEVEAERKAKLRNARHGGAGVEEGLKIGERNARGGGKNEAVKEAWEIEAEQGLLTEGAKRRARAAVSNASSPDSAKRQVVEKEPWEIEAEQGLLTAGAKRRARAAAAAAAAESKQTTHNGTSSPGSKSPGTPSISPSPTGTGSVLSNSQFYDKSSLTLTLPPSTLSKAPPHARSFSYAPVSKRLSLGADSSASDLALAIPTPTMPLAVIVSQPLAYTLRSLILVNRRKDPTFTLPDGDGVYLPSLEELSLEGCNLPDSVSVTRGDSGDETALRRTTEPLLPLLTRLFPSLRTLDLSYNTLTSAALTKDVLSSLILASPPEEGDSPHSRKGLRHIRLRGNRINDLDGFQGIAELFKGNRSCPLWKLEELDLRDNEIGKLPPELGLLPLDVFLVDGNLFRVPQRRIWEREGTKGLLTWLRMRIE